MRNLGKRYFSESRSERRDLERGFSEKRIRREENGRRERAHESELDEVYEENRRLREEMLKLREANANLVDERNHLKGELYDKQMQIESLRQIDANSKWRRALLVYLTNQEASRKLTNQAIREIFGGHPDESADCANFINGAACGSGFILADDVRMSVKEMFDWSENRSNLMTRFNAAGEHQRSGQWREAGNFDARVEGRDAM